MSPAELDFCSYVEQCYRLIGELPTFERIKENLGYVNRSEYDRMWGSKNVRSYLSGIGIDLERVLASSDALLPIQLLAINTLLDFNDPRPDHKKLTALGIKSRTYQLWRSDPAFTSYLKSRVEKIVGTEDDEIGRSLFERARDGDVTAIKFYYEVTGKYRPAQPGQQQDLRYLLLRITEVLTRNLQQYPELMHRIGLELEGLSNLVPNGVVNDNPVGQTIIQQDKPTPVPQQSILP